MDFDIYDIYTDASIDPSTKMSCSGAITVNRKTNEIVNKIYLLIPNSTNNNGEIAAVWLGVNSAINLKHTNNNPYLVNLLSDSQISLFGVRTWILNWIRNVKGGQLCTSSGAVSNQEWFVDIYRAITMHGIKLKFFHIKGHVVDTSRSMFEADRMFRTSNKISARDVGMSIQNIAYYNNMVDAESRNAIYSYLGSGQLPEFTYLGGKIPILNYEFLIQDRQTYAANIKGGLNYPLNYTMEGN